MHKRKSGFVLSVTFPTSPNKGEKVKRANKFETPGDELNIIVSMVNDGPSLRPRKPSFPRSLECLKRPGVTITDFNSTVDNEGID
jgi:hypothetical protein